jgi:hypothetical protein
MSARDTLTPELRAEVLRLEDDLRARVASLPDVQSAWRAEYDAARAAERTAAAWEAWVDERVTLAAVAWVLTTVFIRFCEDNALVKPVWISGSRSREAIDAQQQFLRETARTNPDVTDREWLLQAVAHLKSLAATAGLVDDTSPMWLVTPSGDAATTLLNFWRERDETGALTRDLSDPDLDTRFLGDLYQEISEDAKKRYALLQTPVFVEEFILDRTLEPALNERPLDGFKMIDPTCGSGHFLLGGFQRLLDRWHKHAPGLDERERVQAALDSVYGVDINPFAVAIARFRLTVAALEACGLTSLEDAPAFKYHLAAGDSLRHGLDQQEIDLGAELAEDRVAANFVYATENIDALRAILRNGQYDAVVGNPPYITVSDKSSNAMYRRMYAPYCKGTYQLTVPFMVRFHQLARAGQPAGWIGQITGDGFTNKQFGVPVITKFLPTKDLRAVFDLSGAYIPGHGTPTVIIISRNARPISTMLRAVLGVRGEPKQPDDPAMGLVWRSIVEHWDAPGFSGDWVTVTDIERASLSKHPWSLSGGGASQVKAAIEAASTRGVRAVTAGKAGFASFPGADDAVIAPASALRRDGVEMPLIRALIIGELVRDFRISPGESALVPYTKEGELLPLDEDAPWARRQWALRTELKSVTGFEGETAADSGKPWWGWYRWVASRYRTALTITFAEVATHNHFVLDRGGKVFNRSAPVIKLPEGSSEAQHLALLGVLNSSVACFWLRQVCPKKGGSGIGRGIQPEAWMDRYNFNSTNVDNVPLPKTLPLEHARALDALGADLARRAPVAVATVTTPSRALLDENRREYASLQGQMVAQQEELDWEVYRLYGLVDADLTYGSGDLPELSPGERTFEIVLARNVAAGKESTAWFERHRSEPVLEIPTHWPDAYRDLVQRRIEAIESNQYLCLLEKPEHKRRWGGESWDKQEERALREWLLERLESEHYWFDKVGRPAAKSLAVLADAVSRDGEFVSVLALWERRLDVPVVRSLERLVGLEVVPYLAAYRYTEAGIRKRAAWEATWASQRREDAGTYDSRPIEHGGEGPIPIPPKYVTADFKKPEYWAHRGKLDVPKERFILYAGAGREGDTTPVLGWAGWDHAQHALALASLIQSGEQQGWSEERLIPLVAGLSELLPWVEQWHSDPDPLYGGSSPGEFFSGLLDNHMARLGATRESLAAWRPPAPTHGRKAKS